MKGPTIIELSSHAQREAARAKWFRINVLHMGRSELARLGGGSFHDIELFERGYDDDGKAISPRAQELYWLFLNNMERRNGEEEARR
jgi:hypothetical protein